MNRTPDTIIRNIEKLGLSPYAKKLAYQLNKKIDMPVVFWINSTCDKNYSNRLPYRHNEYWVTVKPQTEQSEYDRLVLAGLCRGIHNRKRYLVVKPNDSYWDSINSPHIIKQYSHFLNHIYSFVSTIVIEAFLSKHSIVTSKNVRQEQFEILTEQINSSISRQQRGQNLVTDFRYFDMVIDLSNYFRLNKEYKSNIIKIVSKIKPKSTSKALLQHIRSLSYSIENTLTMYDMNNGTKCLQYLVEETIKQLALQKYVEIEYPYAMAQLDEENKIYSFIPEDIPNEQLYIDCFRYSNTCVVILQSYYDGIFNKIIPDPHINIKFSKEANAYAYGNIDNYFITFTNKLFLKLHSDVYALDSQAIPEKILSLVTKENLYKTILKYCIFYITLHEMAHILNGDCESPSKQNKEQLADDFSNKLIKAITVGQYRPEFQDPIIDFLNFQKKSLVDDYALEKAYSIVVDLQDRI